MYSSKQGNIQMKNLYFLLILCTLTTLSFAQYTRGTVKERLSIDSKILGKQVNYTIYLPYDYETSSRDYPVVYLLHGHGDSHMGWIQFGEANLIADEGIANREFPAMILVMPDGGVSYYINSYDNKVRYEDFFIQEFIPFIEKTYRIRTEKQYRGIAGLSMGGYGALNFALKFPEKFAACAAFSPVLFSENYMKETEDQKYQSSYAPLFGPDEKGDKRLTGHYRKNNPFDITRSRGNDVYKEMRLYIDCGDDDYLTDDNCRFHIHLNQLKIKHEFRMRDGVHGWTYWRSGLSAGLKFIGESFHKL